MKENKEVSINGKIVYSEHYGDYVLIDSDGNITIEMNDIIGMMNPAGENECVRMTFEVIDESEID